MPGSLQKAAQALVQILDSCAVHFASGRDRGSPAQTFQTINAAQFASKVDALLELLDVTADALAATWDQRASGRNDFGRRFNDAVTGGTRL